MRKTSLGDECDQHRHYFVIIIVIIIIIITIIIMFVYLRLSNATNTEQWHNNIIT